MNDRLSQTLALVASIALAACGGGGDSSSNLAAATPSSHWTMDSHTYVNGGFSAQSTSTVGGQPITVAVISTATLAGGDASNGAYSGGSLSISFVAHGAGTYNVVPDTAALLASDPASNPMVVQSEVGIGVTTGATLYAVSTGQVTVTLDSDGKYHFDSVGVLPAAKTLDVLGGVTGAPASMALTVHDAF